MTQRGLTDDDQRLLRPGEERLPLRQIGGAGAEMGQMVGQVGFRPDQTDLRARLDMGLADARVQHRRFPARIGADQQDGVRFLDPGDLAVEDVMFPRRVGQ